MNKKALYETIMRLVSKEVKKALNENITAYDWIAVKNNLKIDIDADTYISAIEKHNYITGLFKVYVYSDNEDLAGPSAGTYLIEDTLIDMGYKPLGIVIEIDSKLDETGKFKSSGLFIDGDENYDTIGAIYKMDELKKYISNKMLLDFAFIALTEEKGLRMVDPTYTCSDAIIFV